MKLFGNKRRPARMAEKKLAGWKKGLLLLAVCLALLTGALAVLYQSFVKPPEIIVQPEAKPITEEQEEKKEEEEAFVPPTVVQIETKLDEQTGEEITVEVELPASHKEGFYNILICGTDDDGMRTDTIMIGRLDTQEHTAALLSIPRDTLIDGSYTVPKINSVFGANGGGTSGMEALRTRLAQLLGFEVDGYVLVNLDAFVELVDLVGGVEFDVPMDMDYEDSSQKLYIHLKKGMQTLDGQQAMGVVRFRKGYATQDIQRTQTQQQFLKALANKCLSVVNLGKLGEMAQIVLDNVTTDLTLGNIAYFGQELLKCDFDQMYTHTLQGEAVWVKDASCYAIYKQAALDVVNEYFNPYETEITADHVSIRTPEEVKAEQAAQQPLEEETPAEEEPEAEQPEENPEEIVPGDPWDQYPWEMPEEKEPDPWEDDWTQVAPDWDEIWP